MKDVWVFVGEGGRFPSAVYASLEEADAGIERLKLSGLLTCHPIGLTVFEHVKAQGYFEPKREFAPEEIGTFTSAYLKHYHYEGGIR